MTVTYRKIHEVVSNTTDAFWDGWTAVFWRQDPSGYLKTNGMFRNGQWGVAFKSNPNSYGHYRVPKGIAVK